MKTKHLYEVSTINEENDQVKIKYEKELEEMETNFNEKLIFEYEKYKVYLLENTINICLKPINNFIVYRH